MARRRMGRGEGGIIQRGDGSWEARISLGHGEDGKRKTRSLYVRKSKAEIQEKLHKLQNDAASGLLAARRRSLTVGQYSGRGSPTRPSRRPARRCTSATSSWSGCTSHHTSAG